MKRREREIGPLIEKVARNSCQETLQVEITLARETRDDNSQPVELTASYDISWQRSTGRVYNSKSGHGCLIGQNTGNVVGYGSRKTLVGYVKNASKNNVTVPKHDCRYNWSGSA
ncbi:uncharacterized protein LOC124268670 [Haliotis rubra]|uniref:uncharacterized protein LOC124268670 n=1 Tax=Haliotis rubra TaxID=36100 RepID=UPI001EE50FAD|nr:uncharacterized protein LOC124268670 [Haliotis rubra]